MEKPDIYNYTEIEKFLSDHFDYSKSKNVRWSYNSWAHILGVKNGSTILKVLKGERRIGDDLALKFCNYFKFDETQTSYFKDLVQLSKIDKKSKLGQVITRGLREVSGEKSRNAYEYSKIEHFSIWHIILGVAYSTKYGKEIKSVEDFEQILIDPPSKEDLRKIFSDLTSQKLIVLNENGKYDMAEEHTAIDLGENTAKLIKNISLDSMLLGYKWLKERDINPDIDMFAVYTGAIRSSDFKKLRLEIDTFMNGLIREYNVSDQNADSVYQFQIQLFPLDRDST